MKPIKVTTIQASIYYSEKSRSPTGNGNTKIAAKQRIVNVMNGRIALMRRTEQS